MSQFLEKHNIPQVIQYSIGNLNSPITIKEIELIILKLKKKKKEKKLSGTDGFTTEFYQTLEN